MAEFCRDCFYKYNPKCGGYHLKMSRDKDICEGCGKWKRVVETIEPGWLFEVFGIFERDDNKDNK